MNHQQIKNLFVAAAIAVGLAACSESTEEQEDVIRPVRSTVINDDLVASLRTFSGVSRSAQESRLSFKVSGTVLSVPVNVGDKIDAGTVIASLDSSAYELQLEQAQASVEQSHAASRNARSAYERTRGLYANNNASLGDLDTARANTDSAAAQLRAARKTLQLAELNLSYTDLKVDVNCVVDSISVSVNENVSTSSEVARVNCSDELEIEVAVPESIIGNFANGRRAEIKFDAIGGKSFGGQVIEVGVTGNGVGATFPVTVLIDRAGDELRAGLAASVSFASSASENNYFVLPLSAIVNNTDETYVYIVITEKDNFGVIEKRAVVLGELQSGGVGVISGLEKGDRVVTAGASFVREGLSVIY